MYYKANKNNLILSHQFASSVMMPSTETSHSSTDTLERISRSGDVDAFDRLYKKYAALLMGLIIKIVPDEKAAGELLEQSFLEIWARRAEFNSSHKNEFIWMMHIARTCALSAARQININNEIHNTTVSVDNSGKVVQLRFDKSVEAAAEQPAKTVEQQVFHLVHYSGQGVNQVADVLGLTTEEVGEHLRKAIKLLKSVRNE